jgi:hypothetical protein
MASSDEECMCCAREYVRLAGLTDNLYVRDQLIDFARGWMVAAQRKGRSDDARVVTLSRLALGCEQRANRAFARKSE